MKAVHVVVAGRVQGVSFRDACQHVAQSHAVAGWVRNRDDGNVEAVFSGADETVDALVDWCRTGPSAAQVDSVDTRPLGPEQLSELADHFEVR